MLTILTGWLSQQDDISKPACQERLRSLTLGFHMGEFYDCPIWNYYPKQDI
jgi:hypothetical protein